MNRLALALRTLAAAEGIIVSVILGAGAEVFHPGTGILVFGIALYVPALIDRLRR